jgi:site-specific DNA-methyltransferase (adenine-specific)
MPTSTEVNAAAALLALVARRGGAVGARDLQRADGRRYPSARAAAAALNDLVRAGHGSWVRRRTGKKGGRPTRVFTLRVPDTTPPVVSGNLGRAGVREPVPYYDDGLVRLYLGNVRQVLPALDLAGFGVALLDAPYGVRHRPSWESPWEGDSIRGDEDTALRDWLIGALAGRPLFVFGAPQVPPPAGVRAYLCWDKGARSGGGDLDVRWKPSWEMVYVIGGADDFTGPRDEGVIKGHPIVPCEAKGRRHPHQKPVGLMQYLIGKTRAKAVLEPCCGTAPACRAAKDLGLRAVGVEVEERYCEEAARRLEQATLPEQPHGKKK